jgi:RNA polymerase sigma factor (sigma-70 family)
MGPSAGAVREIEALWSAGTLGPLSDTQLLDRFFAGQGEPSEIAFATVVERHGPMVLGVCRRILGHDQDAEDAFQATFLVLARKGRGLARKELLANWLYGVAVRTARELKAANARRLAREGEANAMTRPRPASDENLDELRAGLDEELSRLPASFRAAVVLCDLQDKTHDEAARILELPIGTVSSRLVRGREKLRKRLVRRGLTLSAGAIAAVCAQEAAAKAVTPALVDATANAAVQIASGGAVPASLAALSARVSNSLLQTALLRCGTSLGVVVVLTAAIGGGMATWVGGPGKAGATAFSGLPADDLAWVDDLPNADQATKDRLKRCVRSAQENFRKLHRLVYDFDLTHETFLNDGQNHFTFQTHQRKGRLYWNEGAVRYDFDGQSPWTRRDGKGQPPAGSVTYSVLRTDEMVAQIEDHELYGLVLTVNPPPKTTEDWIKTYHPLGDLDPRMHYASGFCLESELLKTFWSRARSIESKEDGATIDLKFSGAENGPWWEITCDKNSDTLPLKERGGMVQRGEEVAFSEQRTDWKQMSGVWYPARYVKVAYIGAEHRPTTEYDLRVSNLRANLDAKIPAAVFTLSDLPLPEGNGGWDNRQRPPLGLIRANGIVRERRPSEPFHVRGISPAPAPAASDTPARIAKQDYIDLVSEYQRQRRNADQAMMKARSEAEQAAGIDRVKRLESDYAGRFLAIAERHKGDPVALDALATVVVDAFSPTESLHAAEILIRDHLRDPGMRRLYAEIDSPHLAFLPAAEKIQRAGMTDGEPREARARACVGLAHHLRWRARNLRQVIADGSHRFLGLTLKASGIDASGLNRQGMPDRFEKEAEQLYVRLVEQFADVPFGSETMADEARRELFKIRDLAIGKPAPTAEGPDVDGKPMKLSDYRGKVVVLTFNAGWSHEGKNPLERALVERMKGRPCVLLSVNCDSEKETLLKSIREGDPGARGWRCWWEGGEDGPIRTRWHVNEIPSVFVIDADGIIRAKELDGKALDDAIERLVKECERKTTK